MRYYILEFDFWKLRKYASIFTLSMIGIGFSIAGEFWFIAVCFGLIGAVFGVFPCMFMYWSWRKCQSEGHSNWIRTSEGSDDNTTTHEYCRRCGEARTLE